MRAEGLVNELIASQLARKGPVDVWGSYQVQHLDMRPLKLDLSALQPVLFRLPNAPPADWAEIVRELLTYSREKGAGPALLYVDERPLPSAVAADPDLAVHGIALLDAQSLSAFQNTRDRGHRYQALGAAIARCLGRRALSPYVSGKPARGGRFFGRKSILDQIVSGRTINSCTIVGNRRIGKTSILHEVKDRLGEIYALGKSIHFSDLYASKCHSTWDAVYLILSQLDIAIPKNITKYGAIAPRFVKRFPQLLKEFCRSTSSQVVIFIDEFDSFLELDSKQDYEFLNLLREAVMANCGCHVLIAGFRRLMETRVRQESPYFNFTKEVTVLPLTQDETNDMVTTPLSRLGLEPSSALSTLAGIIHRETRGQPELVQMYCQAAIELFEHRPVVPADAELIEYIHREPAFNRTILHTFLYNTNPYEQVVCLRLMSKAFSAGGEIGRFEFVLGDVQKACEDSHISMNNAEMAAVLNNLVVGSIVQRVTGAPGRYRFALPQLLRYCRQLNIDHMLNAAMKEVKDYSPSVHTLNIEPLEVLGQSAG